MEQFLEPYLKVLKQYSDFDSRTNRREFWMFILINFLISIVISFVGNMLGLGFLSIIYSLAIFIPSIAVGARRLHDVSKSGWMQLVALIPLVGIIWLIVLWAGEGDHGDNEYGANPEENFDY